MSAENVVKYFNILETLEFEGASKTEKLKLLKKLKQDDMHSILRKTLYLLKASWLDNERETHNFELHADDDELVYAVYLQHLMLEITHGFNFNSEAREDLISARQLSQCIKSVQDLSIYLLRRQLHVTFYESKIFKKALVGRSESCNFPLLLLAIEAFDNFLKVQQFHLANAMETVIRDYMAAIFSLRLANTLNEFPLKELTLKTLKNKLNYLWLYINKVEYLRNTMLLKSMPHAHTELQKQLHQDLLHKLLSQDGFATLVATLYPVQSEHTNDKATMNRRPLNDKQVFETIANIVAFRGHTQRAQSTLIRQIFKFLNICLLNENAMIDCMGAGLLSLRRLYDLSAINKDEISDIIASKFEPLSRPTDLLSGLILMEHKELSLLIVLVYQLFCSSTIECLPSELLIAYQPLLLQMYHNMPDGFLQKQQVANIILRCLHNRSDNELEDIIVKLYKQTFDSSVWHQLHPRIIIYPNVEQTQLTVKIVSSEIKQESSLSLALPELLMNSEHNLLTYRIFMILLKEMADTSLTQQETQIELLQNEEELIAFFNSKYPIQVEILLSLNTLISHQPLKTQISEHSTDFLHFLSTLLQQRLIMCAGVNATSQHTESMDQTLLILLTITQELLEQTQIPELYKDLLPSLQQLQKQSPNQLVQARIKCLITLLSGELKANVTQKSSAFSMARALIESKESHIQVYGIQMLLDLLRQRDSVTLANVHLLIALALSTLKNHESYTFLNCVRLFVGLVHVIEAEVLETLADEYLNAQASMDYRLVVGEALLKVGQELGPLCYKYKDTLLNCFMNGARSLLNEFRMSSFSNLAQMTRILCYQVQNFFQELLNLIDCELSAGTYLPANRAAVFVLSELLEGIDNLVDFEEMLLPIYRVLKHIEGDENADTKMRQHAAAGLKTLAVKCKKFLFPQVQKQKEIRILGPNETKASRINARHHILELN